MIKAKNLIWIFAVFVIISFIPKIVIAQENPPPQVMEDYVQTEVYELRSCADFGGGDICSEFQRCSGTSIWNASDNNGEDCCVGECIDLSEQEAIQKFQGIFDEEEVRFMMQSYSASPENLSREEIPSPPQEVLLTKNRIILLTAVIFIFIILFIILHLLRKKSKLKKMMILLLFSAFFLASSISASAFRFDVISDTHKITRADAFGKPLSHETIAAAVKSTNPSFIVHSGDFSIGDSFGFPEYDSGLNAFEIFPTTGNHEYNDKELRDPNKNEALEEYDSFWNAHKPSTPINGEWAHSYSFDKENYHFILLDYKRKSLDFLKNEIESNANKNVIIISHVPATQTGATSECKSELDRNLNNLLKNSNYPQVKAVFSGHIHCYEKTEIKAGIFQVIVGTASHDLRAQKGNLPKRHYFAVVDAAPDGTLKVCPASVEDGGKIMEGGCEAVAPLEQKQEIPPLSSLPLREKIAQMIAVADESSDCKSITVNKIGGIFFVTENRPGKNPYQSEELNRIISKCNSGLDVPLISFSDEEGKLVRRISADYQYNAKDIGDGKGDINTFASSIASAMKQAGINVDFAPVLDIWSTSSVIGVRAFSSDKAKVADLGEKFSDVLHSQNIGAVGKHFPGYGDTAGHTDKTVGTNPISEKALLEQHTAVFNQLKPSLDGIMVSSVIYTSVDKSPAVFSSKIVGWARESFNGVIITDDMDTPAIASYLGGDASHGKRAVAAIKAGVDIIIDKDSSKAKSMIDAVETAVKSGEITESRIDESLARIEAMKKKYLKQYAASGQAGAIQSAFQNCQPGVAFGGGVLNTNVNTQGLVPIPEIDGQKLCYNDHICYTTPGDCCVLKESAVKQLYPLYKLFKEKGYQLKVVSPYRSLELYMKNWDESEKNSALNCPPRDVNGNKMSSGYGPENFKHCPHYNGVAIDIFVEDANGNQIPYEERIKIACEAGWINYHHEGWHFEYGSNDWKTATAAQRCQDTKVEAAVKDNINAAGDKATIRTNHKSITFEQLSKPPITDPTPYITQSSASPEQKPQSELPAPQLTMPSNAISFKQVPGQFGGINVIEADPNYFDVRTMSAKTMIEDVGGQQCPSTQYGVVGDCYGNIVDIKARIPSLNIVAAVNGGLFSSSKGVSDKTDTTKYGFPDGDYVENGKLIQGKSHDYGSTWKYNFVVENGLPKIVDRAQYSFNPSISSVVTGAEETGTPVTARTMVCITNQGKVKLATASSASIKEMEEYMITNENCAQVMNVDGGGSTQHYFEFGGQRNVRKSSRPVANFIVVVPKGGAAYGAPTLCPPMTVVNSPDEGILYAAYNVKPSFAVEVNKDFGGYDKIKNAIAKYLDQCAGGIDCLSDKISADSDFKDFSFYFKDQKLNFAPKNKREEWNAKCENPDQEFLNDFIGFYQNCRDSATTEQCKCTFRYSEYSSALSKNGKVNADTSAKALFKARLSNYEYNIQTDSGAFATSFPSEITKEGADFKFKIGTDEQINPVLSKRNKDLQFASSASSQILGGCEIQNTMIRVCVVNKEIAYKFALKIEDLPPPPVENVNAEDLNRTKDFVMLSWTKVTPTDIAKYRIYSADANFKDKEPADQMTDIIKELDPTSPASVQTVFKFLGVKAYCDTGCEYKLNVVYRKDLQEVPGSIEIRDGVFIYDETTNKYFYIQAAPDGLQQFYGVTAVDKKQQESPEFLQTPGAVSEDDTPPAQVAVTAVSDAGTVTISWVRPAVSIAGSEINPEAGIQYDIYKKCPAETAFIILHPNFPETSLKQTDAGCSYKAIAKRYIAPDLIPIENSEIDRDFVKYLLQ